MLPATAEGGGCTVMVGAGVMVGVVAATMAEREGGWCGYLQKTEGKKYQNTVWYVRFIILSYVISK